MKIKDIKLCAFSSGDCDCVDDCYCWEYTSENITELLSLALKENRSIAVISATKINWLNASGSKIIDVEGINAGDFFRAFVGGDYDCTVSNFKAIKNGFSVRVSSHDIPTGGNRIITFMTFKEFYIKNKDAIQKYNKMTYREIENTCSASDLIDMV